MNWTYRSHHPHPCRCATSVASRRRTCPFASAHSAVAGDIFDGGVEPDVERPCPPSPASLLIRFLTGTPQSRSRVMPRSLQTVAVIQPFLGDGGGQDWPVFPCCQSMAMSACSRRSRLFEVEMLGFAHSSRSVEPEMALRGIDQIGRIQLFGAVFALIAARACHSRTVRTGSPSI